MGFIESFFAEFCLARKTGGMIEQIEKNQKKNQFKCLIGIFKD
jgi:hypothetical protein